MKYLFLTAIFILPLALIPVAEAQAQDDDEFKIARVQYRGGGDWYSSPTALTNMLRFVKEQVPISVSEQYDDVQLGSRDIFNYPFLFITGHGNISINEAEMENLRRYLESGGFLYVDDDYGLDQYIRPYLERIFPDEDLIELPADHPIYTNVYNFPNGRPPKVHEHDNQPPQAFGIFHEGRMVVLYTYESNPSDGWAYDEHDNPQSITDAALRFGVNLLVYALISP
ncbi:DUF4159 domain-containing protein [Rhodohalobacter sp. 8-1]|uniref:DUF4159 domain-containing protein n=1 Tax=Rhodohalobacter sp. 8-1 TaxID=3131972 RepID=UPI0030EC0BFB